MKSNIVSTIVKKVFPEGAELCSKGKENSSSSKFWIIPGKGNEPRWILPDDPNSAIAFLQQWRPYDFQSRIKWQGLMFAYRQQKLNFIPGVIPLQINIPKTANWKHFGSSFDKDLSPVIYVGSPGSRRKAVLGLIDTEKNNIIGIGKVPLGTSAGHAINHEVDLLDTLAKEKPGKAPRTLYSDRKKGIATQEFFTGAPTGRFLTYDHIKFLVDLAIPGESVSLSETVKDIEKKINCQENIQSDARKILKCTLKEINDSSPLPTVWEHGDFAPWNLKNGNNGSLRAIDWEAASRKGLPLFDLVHFYSIQAFEFKTKELFPKQFKTLLRQYLETLGIALGMTRKIVLGCIIQDWLRRHEEGDHTHANFLLHTLASPLGDLI